MAGSSGRQVIPIRDNDVRRELLLVAYLQSADGARFTMAGWPFRPLTAVDDHGGSYQIGFRGGHAAAELVLPGPAAPYSGRRSPGGQTIR